MNGALTFPSIMSSFSFNFAKPTDGVNGSTHNNDEERNISKDANELIANLIDRSVNNTNECKLVNVPTNTIPPTTHESESIDLQCSYSKMMDSKLHYVIPQHKISDDTTDLIPGVYEGGLKVWECSIDLCRYLAQIIYDLDNKSSKKDAVHMAVSKAIAYSGSTMELGCGHGLPGCLILREIIRRANDNQEETQDKSVVIFSDFNDFVLQHCTIPNCQINLCGKVEQDLAERSMFVGGDWLSLSHKLSSNKLPLRIGMQEGEENDRLDLILAAETTYSLGSCQDTVFLMLRHLKIDCGVGLVATKRFYFGVGGGTDQFMAACNKLSMADQGPYSTLRLCVRTIKSYDTGNSNIRDLLEVRCRKKK